MAAFQDAIDLGYRYLETDVHSSVDGVLFAFHDADLSRTCGVEARIGDLTADELVRMRVAGSEPIPRLEELFEAWPSARLNIDCKSDEALEPLVEVLRRRRVLDRVCVGSFSDSRLRRMREALGPELCTSLGPREVAALVARSALPKRREQRSVDGRIPHAAHAAQVPTRQGPVPLVTDAFLRTCARSGLAVHVWTIDDPNEMRALLDLGVHGIMTDDTRALRDVLTARGQWA
jgi:glycerophosphoryl diester phosphodiesterase